MTEIVDKSMIERLILEHSDRLQLEVNQKARADAWKFYYRVRVDTIVRPFAVCKVCYRVLHCDSRSGTASLLRHPCNPLSERSPVNRAVKLSAKLNLPSDNHSLKNEMTPKNPPLLPDRVTRSPVSSFPPSTTTASSTVVTTCPSPTSTESPPSAAPPAVSSASASSHARKRKAASTPPVLPLEFQLFPLPQLVAAAASHPFSALNLANMFSERQHLQSLQQLHQTQLLREPQQDCSDDDFKRVKEEVDYASRTNGSAYSPDGASRSNNAFERPKIKKERTESGVAGVVVAGDKGDNGTSKSGADDADDSGRSDSRGTWSKVMVQVLVNAGSPRVTLADKDPSGAHHISDVWSRFSVVYVDGILRPFAACKLCSKVVTYTKYSGTGGLLRHKCSSRDLRALDVSVKIPDVDIKRESSSPPVFHGASIHFDGYSESSPCSSPLSLITRPREVNDFAVKQESGVAPTSAMVGVARALLRYMCHDLVSTSIIDSAAFHQLLWSVINLGAAHGSFREEELLPTSGQLLDAFLEPMVADSKSSLVRCLLSQTHLSLSVCYDDSQSESCLALGMHFITSDFELKNHVIGTYRSHKGEDKEVIISKLLEDYFQSNSLPLTLKDKHITVVSDEPSEDFDWCCVTCIWHAAEMVMDELPDHSAYNFIFKEVEAILYYLADSGVDSVSSCGLKPQELHRWESLLHALTFITAHYDELKVVLGVSPNVSAPTLGDRDTYEEIVVLLAGIRRCLLTVRDLTRPTLNQAVLCRAKLLQLCKVTNAANETTRQLKEHLSAILEDTLPLTPLHLVASFLDPRCKSLKVLSESKKAEVHALVLEMLKGMSGGEPSPQGVLNLTTQRHSFNCEDGNSSESHPFREYMDNGAEAMVSDGEEVMAYINMKVHLEDDNILGWWASASASALPMLRKLARKVLAVPATCSFAHQIKCHSIQAREKMGITDSTSLNNILHVKYNMS